MSPDLQPVATPFAPDGGMRLLTGNLGRCVIKTSAVVEDRWIVEAPCAVFETQDDVLAAFKAGKVTSYQDVIEMTRPARP